MIDGRLRALARSTYLTDFLRSQDMNMRVAILRQCVATLRAFHDQSAPIDDEDLGDLIAIMTQALDTLQEREPPPAQPQSFGTHRLRILRDRENA